MFLIKWYEIRYQSAGCIGLLSSNGRRQHIRASMEDLLKYQAGRKCFCASVPCGHIFESLAISSSNREWEMVQTVALRRSMY